MAATRESTVERVEYFASYMGMAGNDGAGTGPGSVYAETISIRSTTVMLRKRTALTWDLARILVAGMF